MQLANIEYLFFDIYLSHFKSSMNVANNIFIDNFIFRYIF